MKLTARETVLFGLLGALLYATKRLMEVLPNIHLVGVLVIAMTVVYRKKALYPLYTYVFIDGLTGGFSTWWVPYLYIWTLLWGAAMLLPRAMPRWLAPAVYMVLCAVHGFLFGILYSPAQALFFGLNFEQTVAWIITGLPFDLIHGVSNLIAGVLICPIIAILRNAEKYTGAR